MQIMVTSCPKIDKVSNLFSDFLYPLNLTVDDSFAADGSYHVPSHEVIQALHRERMPQLAQHWEAIIRERNWTHVAIPAHCCRIIGQEEHIEVEL